MQTRTQSIPPPRTGYSNADTLFHNGAIIEDVRLSDDETDLRLESAAFLLQRTSRPAPLKDHSPDGSITAEISYSLLDRAIEFIMSVNPLVKRPSPSSSITSYGAVRNAHSACRLSSRDTSHIEPDRARERDRSAHTGRSRTLFGPAESTQSIPRQRTSRSRGRQSFSQTSEYDTELELRRTNAGIGSLSSKLFDPREGSLPTGAPTHNRKSPSTERKGRGETENNSRRNSPLSQVRASVSATDDPTQSISTPRMWILSLIFALLGSATNLFFSLRYPSVFITPVIALVLVHPLGKLWDWTLKLPHDPDEIFYDGVRQGFVAPEASVGQRVRLWLAQGRWNEKEHACVYISSNVSFGFAFATDVIVEQHKFYKQDVPILYQILLTISTQILGYAFAGLTRRYLVRPAAMIWPGTLMPAAMFTTLHQQRNEPANGWTISRYRFFVWVWAAGFSWYFLPGFLFPALSYFNVITWFAPKNVVIANLFGVSSGLGLFPLTFDWAQIAYIGSPLLTPWWAAANVVGGLVLVMWILAPILYYTNTFYSAYLPILSSDVFDNMGKPYDVSRILTPGFVFDKAAYNAYSRVYLPITYVLSYAVQIAALSSLVTHTACWHGRDIWRQSKAAFSERNLGQSKTDYQPIPSTSNEELSFEQQQQQQQQTGRRSSSDNFAEPVEDDIHCRLMARYPDVPMYWYLGTLIAMLCMGIFVVEYYPVHLPWYGVILALAITSLLFIPVGIVMAITNQHSSLYLVSQLMAGSLFPGRPVANMVFVTYSYITSAQGVKFSSDLKLGHYMKIPPRLLFKLQMTSTVISSLAQIATLNWMFAHVPDLCQANAGNGLSCPLARVHFNGSILWGVVGPTRFFFSPHALYRPLIWAFPIGALAPVILWLSYRRLIHLQTTTQTTTTPDPNPNPKPTRLTTLLQSLNLPVLFGTLSWIPPATGLNFSVWALTCYLFNSVLARSGRYGGWWAKYTMTLSAALDSGLAFAVLVVFFVLVFPGWGGGGGAGDGDGDATSWFSWWGTEVYKRGCDWNRCSFLRLGEGERFGG